MKRYENLDGLRAISCMGIVAMHLYTTAGYAGESGLLDTVISSWALLVIPFMMLSGFGICAGYLERFQAGKISLETFYARRYSKVLPFFLVTTLIGVIAEHSLRGIAEGIIELSLVFGFLPNNSNCFNVNGVCWTLGTIFAFYLLFPFISVLLKNKKRAWMAFAASVMIQLLCETLFMTEDFVLESYINRTNVLYSMPFFLAGGLLYIFREDIQHFVSGNIKSERSNQQANSEHKWCIYHKGRNQRQYCILLVCILATVFYYIMPDAIFDISISDQKTAFVFSLWSIYAIGAKSVVLSNRILNVIAKYSMEIYLSHMIVLKALRMLRATEIMEKNVMSFLAMFALLMVMTVAFILVVNFGIKWSKEKVKNSKKTLLKCESVQSRK